MLGLYLPVHWVSMSKKKIYSGAGEKDGVLTVLQKNKLLNSEALGWVAIIITYTQKIVS